MDLGIKGKWALVCAASKGLGKGCAEALAAEGVNVVITARGAEALEATAAELRARGRAAGEVRTVAGDITTPEGRAAALAACPQVDILVNNAGGPPPGDFRDWDREAWIKALDANMLTPIELIKATVDGMAERGFGRIVNITSACGEGADRRPGPVQRRAQRPDRLRRRPGAAAAPGLAQRDDQQPAARRLRHRPPAQPRLEGAAQKTGQSLEQVAENAAPDGPARRFGTRRSSARCAPSCAARRPATSPARTCCSTAAPTRARSDQARGARSDDTTMPPTMQAKASAWYPWVPRPAAALTTGGKQGVRLLKKAASAGPPSATPRPQQR
jgi:3-oxoacyl-[acyl-carrier protein] reductase